MTSLQDTVAGFLWQQSCQIPLIFASCLIACWILRNASAHWRYLLWLVVTAKCVMPPIVSLPLPLLPAAEDTVRMIPAVDASASNGRAAYDLSGAMLNRSSHPIPQQAQSAATSPGAIPAGAGNAGLLSPGLLNLREWLMTGWLLIAGILLIRIIVRMWSTSRQLQRTTQPADSASKNSVAASAKALGLKTAPDVHMGDSIAQPFVWGWLRGDIYLPLSFSSMGTDDQRRGILMHELGKRPAKP